MQRLEIEPARRERARLRALEVGATRAIDARVVEHLAQLHAASRRAARRSAVRGRRAARPSRPARCSIMSGARAGHEVDDAACPAISPPCGATTTRRDAVVARRPSMRTDAGLSPSHGVNAAAMPLRPRARRLARRRRRHRSRPAPSCVSRVDEPGVTDLPVASMRCGAGRHGDVRAHGDDLAVADEHRAVLDRRAAHRVHLAAGDGDRLRARARAATTATRAPARRREPDRRASLGSLHVVGAARSPARSPCATAAPDRAGRTASRRRSTPSRRASTR